jgi:hypothetical protein
VWAPRAGTRSNQVPVSTVRSGEKLMPNIPEETLYALNWVENERARFSELHLKIRTEWPRSHVHRKILCHHSAPHAAVSWLIASLTLQNDAGPDPAVTARTA